MNMRLNQPVRSNPATLIPRSVRGNPRSSAAMQWAARQPVRTSRSFQMVKAKPTLQVASTPSSSATGHPLTAPARAQTLGTGTPGVVAPEALAIAGVATMLGGCMDRMDFSTVLLLSVALSTAGIIIAHMARAIYSSASLTIPYKLDTMRHHKEARIFTKAVDRFINCDYNAALALIAKITHAPSVHSRMLTAITQMEQGKLSEAAETAHNALAEHTEGFDSLIRTFELFAKREATDNPEDRANLENQIEYEYFYSDIIAGRLHELRPAANIFEFTRELLLCKDVSKIESLNNLHKMLMDIEQEHLNFGSRFIDLCVNNGIASLKHHRMDQAMTSFGMAAVEYWNADKLDKAVEMAIVASSIKDNFGGMPLMWLIDKIRPYPHLFQDAASHRELLMRLLILNENSSSTGIDNRAWMAWLSRQSIVIPTISKHLPKFTSSFHKQLEEYIEWVSNYLYCLDEDQRSAVLSQLRARLTITPETTIE